MKPTKFQWDDCYLLQNFQLVSDSAASMLAALGHCLTLFQQQEEVENIYLKHFCVECFDIIFHISSNNNFEFF